MMKQRGVHPPWILVVSRSSRNKNAIHQILDFLEATVGRPRDQSLLALRQMMLYDLTPFHPEEFVIHTAARVEQKLRHETY